jgi:hypothetical protein
MVKSFKNKRALAHIFKVEWRHTRAHIEELLTMRSIPRPQQQLVKAWSSRVAKEVNGLPSTCLGHVHHAILRSVLRYWNAHLRTVHTAHDTIAYSLGVSDHRHRIVERGRGRWAYAIRDEDKRVRCIVSLSPTCTGSKPGELASTTISVATASRMGTRLLLAAMGPWWSMRDSSASSTGSR